mgnify:CR=1 FL=1
MIGVPGETEDDLVELVREAAELSRAARPARALANVLRSARGHHKLQEKEGRRSG